MEVVIRRNISSASSGNPIQDFSVSHRDFLPVVSYAIHQNILKFFKARLITWQLKSKKRLSDRERARSQKEKLDPKKGHLFMFTELDTIK
jgi:hypothetical protein